MYLVISEVLQATAMEIVKCCACDPEVHMELKARGTFQGLLYAY